MENIIQIFKDDVRGLGKNFLALVIALGLCVIPSLMIQAIPEMMEAMSIWAML